MKIWEPECQFGWKKENKMAYRFAFYTKDNFEQIQQMILDSYKWDFPIFGLSRFEFSAYLHPEFTGLHRVWERTCGLWFDGDKIAGGDQTFYEKIGFAEKATCEQYAWQQEIFPSWDKRSEKIKYEI